MSTPKLRTAALLLLALLPATASAADVSVCVDVLVRSANGEAPSDAVRVPAPPTTASTPSEAEVLAAMRAAGVLDGALPPTPYVPAGQSPEVYLKRLLEHFVTHAPGYVAVGQGCQQHLQVELYPLSEGWTAFARFSENGREERVDHLFPDELSQFSERAVTALLSDVPISTTILRDTVLRADSMQATQTVKGTHHFEVALGTQMRGGMVDTAQSNGSAANEFRFFSPMTLGAGYRAKFENWGLEAGTRLGLGVAKQAPTKNNSGGHVDLDGLWSLTLHAQRYLDPRGLHSFYLGAGSTFEVAWFSVIRSKTKREWDSEPRNSLVVGGLDVDLVAGWEFLRASRVQFYLQAEANLPAYVMQSSNSDGDLNTWMPGVSIQLGMMF
jgi:hypothetical protein